MPVYDYECPKCRKTYEVVHSIAECDVHQACPRKNCKCNRMFRVITGQVAIKPPPDSGWEYENGGLGREVTQFVDNRYKPGDPRAKRYFRSQTELVETAKREGYTVERQR